MTGLSAPFSVQNVARTENVPYTFFYPRQPSTWAETRVLLFFLGYTTCQTAQLERAQVPKHPQAGSQTHP